MKALVHTNLSLPKNTTDEFRVKVAIRNNRLIALREALKLTQIAAAEKMDIGLSVLNNYETLRKNPINKHGNFKPSALKIADFYGVNVGYAFPDAVADIAKTSVEFTRSAEEMPEGFFEAQAALMEAPTPHFLLEKKTMQENLHQMLGSLTPREENILRMRYFENLTLEQCGERLAVSRERIRGIEAKALRKLRHPSRSERILGVASPPPAPKTCDYCQHTATSVFYGKSSKELKGYVCSDLDCRKALNKMHNMRLEYKSLMGRSQRVF